MFIACVVVLCSAVERCRECALDLVQAGATVALALVWAVALLFFDPFRAKLRWAMFVELGCVVFEVWFMVAIGFIQSSSTSYNDNLLPTSLPFGR